MEQDFRRWCEVDSYLAAKGQTVINIERLVAYRALFQACESNILNVDLPHNIKAAVDTLQGDRYALAREATPAHNGPLTTELMAALNQSQQDYSKSVDELAALNSKVHAFLELPWWKQWWVALFGEPLKCATSR